MTELTLSVPLLPPSVNHLYEGWGRNRHMTAAGHAFKAAVAIFSGGEDVWRHLERNRLRKAYYAVTAKMVLGRGVRGDVDNTGKIIFDSLQYAGVIHTDDRVLEQHFYKDPYERPEHSRTEIHVEVKFWEPTASS